MNKLIRMAKEAGAARLHNRGNIIFGLDALEHFAALIAAEERERILDMDIIRARLAQPKRQWVDLTATEIKLLRRAATNDREFAELLQAKLKEKNGG